VTLDIKWCWIVLLTLDPSLTQYGGWRFIPGRTAPKIAKWSSSALKAEQNGPPWIDDDPFDNAGCGGLQPALFAS
jgi:hypothetical protein